MVGISGAMLNGDFNNLLNLNRHDEYVSVNSPIFIAVISLSSFSFLMNSLALIATTRRRHSRYLVSFCSLSFGAFSAERPYLETCLVLVIC